MYSQRLQVMAAWGGWLLDGYTSISYLLVFSYMAPVFLPGYLGSLRFIIVLIPVSFGGFARSIGSVIFGRLGDKRGRHFLLTFSILGFSISSASIGLIPGYKTIGIAAPAMLYILIFIQGMFAGSEYGAGSAFSMESSGRSSRPLTGAFMQSGYGMGYLMVVTVDLIILYITGNNIFIIYGWRILLLTSLIPGLITLLLRKISRETNVFIDMAASGKIEKRPFTAMLNENKGRLFYIITFMSALLFINTGTFSFYPVAGSENLLNLGGNLLYALIIINGISLFGVIFGGYISLNKNIKKRIILYSFIFLATSWLFIIIGYTRNIYIFIAMFSIQAFLEAMIFSLIPEFLSESFSKKYRSTATGFIYNFGAIPGGLAILLILIPGEILGIKIVWSLEILLASLLLVLSMVFTRDNNMDLDPIMV
ncbi:MFS transporter [Picrophilus oshimae]|uniref:Transporter n=1 Tax=Picrophilus torridus (strain ATCC 700027 / DSM 9790 / JCM 10055 / NBRC 100828 / KAW 2/3) TaxID=1122961 RepID=Q6L2I6_PICTO|nr:MFS transporter [Picrophilus oshimae]AAT42816.1 transporter [Picrophilus oshimae DSM 9789]